MTSSHTSSHFRIRAWLWHTAAIAGIFAALVGSDLRAGDGTGKPDTIRAVCTVGAEVWIGDDDGLLRFDGKKWRRWARGKELPDYAVSAIDVDRDTGDVWLGLWGGGLARLTAGRVDRFTAFNSGLAGDIVFSVVLARGRVWAATDGGVNALEPWREEWSLYHPRHAGAVTEFVTSLAVDGDELYARTSSSATRRFDPARNEWVGIDKPFPATRSVGPTQSRPPSNRSVTGFVRHPAIAVYGPRHRTISLPGESQAILSDPLIPDQVAIGRALEEWQRGRAEGEEAIGILTVIPGYSRYGWGLPEDDIIAFAANPGVLGIVGNMHHDALTAEVVKGTQIPWMNVDRLEPHVHAPTPSRGQSDHNGWTFECFGILPRQHRKLLDHLIDDLGAKRITILHDPGCGDELPLVWWQGYIKRRGGAVAAKRIWAKDAKRRSAMLSKLRADSPDAVLTWSGRATSEELIVGLRKASIDGWIVTGPAIVTADFVSTVGVDPGRILALMPTNRSQEVSKLARSTSGTDQARPPAPRGRRSEPAHARRTELATQHLLAAIGRAGQKRMEVQRVLRAMRLDPFGEAHVDHAAADNSTTVAHFDHGAWRISKIPKRK